MPRRIYIKDSSVSNVTSLNNRNPIIPLEWKIKSILRSRNVCYDDSIKITRDGHLVLTYLFVNFKTKIIILSHNII